MLPEELAQESSEHVVKKPKYTRNTLRDNLKATRYSTPTQHAKYYAETKARDGSYENASFCVSRAIKAVSASRGMDNLGTLDSPDTPIDTTYGPSKPGMAEFRRVSIALFIYCF